MYTTFKHIKNLLMLAMAFSATQLVGQQDPNRTFYKYNMNLINPAYAGSAVNENIRDDIGALEVGLNFRSQWSGIEGAPETQNIFVSKGLGSNLGLGVSIINDQTFIESLTSVTADLSYKIYLSDDTKLFFGIKAGGRSYNADVNRLQSFNNGSDPSLSGDLDGGFAPLVGAGAYLKGQRFFVSLSAPNLLGNTRLEEENGNLRISNSRIHAFLSGGYDFELSSDVILKPSFMLRYVAAAPVSLDITGAIKVLNRLELGVNYRLDSGIGGLLIFDASNWLDFGYAYEVSSTTDIGNVNANNGTHEVFLKFKL